MHDMHPGQFSVKSNFLWTNQRRPKYSEIHHISNWNHILFISNTLEQPIPDKTYHYENKPIQIYWKFYHQKMKIFR